MNEFPVQFARSGQLVRRLEQVNQDDPESPAAVIAFEALVYKGGDHEQFFSTTFKSDTWDDIGLCEFSHPLSFFRQFESAIRKAMTERYGREKKERKLTNEEKEHYARYFFRLCTFSLRKRRITARG